MQSRKRSHLLLDLGTIFGWLELDRSIHSRKVFVYIGLVVEKLGRPNGCKSRDPIQLDGYSNRFRKSANYIPRYQQYYKYITGLTAHGDAKPTLSVSSGRSLATITTLNPFRLSSIAADKPITDGQPDQSACSPPAPTTTTSTILTDLMGRCVSMRSVIDSVE